MMKMISGLRVYRYGLLAFFILWVSFSIPLTGAQTTIEVGETNPPQNIVLLIVDGMGSAYVTPGSTPLALNGDPVESADMPVFKNMISESDVEVIQGSEIVSCGFGDIMYIFTGLKPKINYTVRVFNGRNTLEQSVHLNLDRLIGFETVVSDDDTIVWNGRTLRRYVASVLIFIVIIGGLLLINRIRD